MKIGENKDIMDNGRISPRQCRRALLTELFGMSVFLMSGALVQMSGKWCFLMLLFAAGMIFLLVFFYWTMAAKEEISYGQRLRENGAVPAVVIGIMHTLRFSIRAGFLLAVFYRLLKDFLLQESGFSYVTVPFLLVCVFGALQGRERRLRGMEFLLWLVFVPFVIVLLLVLKDINRVNFFQTVVPDSSFTSAVRETFGQNFKKVPFLFPVVLYANVEFLLFLLPFIPLKRRHMRDAFVPAAISLASNFAILFIAVGVLGYGVMAQISWPAVRVIESARVPGGFLERLDIGVLAFWIFAVYGVICGILFYSGEMLKDTVKCLQNTKNIVPVCITAGIIYLIGMQCHTMQNLVQIFSWYTLLFDIPFGILAAFWVFRIPKRKKGGKMLAVLLLCLLCTQTMSGCVRRNNIEDWDYVVTLGIDPAQTPGNYMYSFGIADDRKATFQKQEAPTLKQAVKKYESAHSHSVQLGHCAAIILGEDLYNTAQGEQYTKALQTVLKELNDRCEIPVTTSVFGAEKTACQAIENGPYDKQTLGEYVNDLYGNNRKKEAGNLALKNLNAAMIKQQDYALAQISTGRKKVKKITYKILKTGK